MTRALFAKFRSLVGVKAGTAVSGGDGKSETARRERAEKNRRLKNLKERLERKDRELAGLREELRRARDGGGSAAGPPHEDAPVFFIVGQAKSGTSWLMRTLNAHPEILCKGEGRFFGRDFKNEDFKRMDLKTIQPSSLYGAIMDSEYLRAWVERSVWTRDGEAEEHLIDLSRLAVNRFLTKQLALSGKRVVGDKTPFLSREILGEVNVVCPEAKVIHIIRDGRDVAVSLMHHRWNRARDKGGTFELDPEEIAKRDAYREDPQGLLTTGEGLFTEARLRGTARSWREHTSRAIADGPALLGENYAEVRYEDLLERPEEEIGRLLRFLRADADEETVRACVDSASFEKWTKGRERGREESTAFLRKGVAGDWRSVFTENDRRVFEEEAGDLLRKLGYEKAPG